MKLLESARVVRSKNAGPTQLTIDIIFDDALAFEAARTSPRLTAAAIAELYSVAPDMVRIVVYAPANAIKIVLDRKIVAGTPGDRDVYGAQQHGPLLELEL